MRPRASRPVPPASRSCGHPPTSPPSARRSPVRLSDVGERGLLAELERRGLVEGIEHDAAELEPGLVATQDSLVEGVHFRLDWLSWRELGFRAAAVNISDLAASAARPEALLVSIGAPAAPPLEAVLELYGGIHAAGVALRRDGRPRVRRGLRAPRGDGRPGPVRGHRTLRGRRGHRGAAGTAAGTPRRLEPLPAEIVEEPALSRQRRDHGAGVPRSTAALGLRPDPRRRPGHV